VVYEQLVGGAERLQAVRVTVRTRQRQFPEEAKMNSVE
jgi:hypothetical protein